MRAPEPKYAVGEQVRHHAGGGVMLIKERWLDVPSPDETCDHCGAYLKPNVEWHYGFDHGCLGESRLRPLDSWDESWGPNPELVTAAG